MEHIPCFASFLEVFLLFLIESSIHHFDGFGINHVGGLSRFADHLDECKGDNSAVDNLFALSGMLQSVRQKGSKEGSEPNGMSTHHNVSFLDRGGKDEIAKIPHALQSARADGFVSGVEAHVDLVHKGRLKVGDIGSLIDPRGLNLCLSWRDGQGIGISADFLEGGQHKNLFLWSTFEAILEPTGNSSDCSPEAGRNQFGGRCIRLCHQDRYMLTYLIALVKVLGEEFGKCLDLVQSKNGSWRVVKPTVGIVFISKVKTIMKQCTISFQKAMIGARKGWCKS